MNKLIVLFACLLINLTLFSQDENLVVSPTEDNIFTEEDQSIPTAKVTFDFDIRAAFTSGEFKQFYPKDGMGGLGISVLFPISKRNPLDVGFELGYYFMSQTRSNLEYYAPGVGDYDIDSRVSGSMIPIHIVGRLYPLKTINFPIQPYIEGVAGFRLFIVNQKINTIVLGSGIELPEQTESTTTGSWSYGFGAGVKIKISKNNPVYLNAKVNQIYGTATKYMDPSSVAVYDDGSFGYENYQSRTDILRFSIGIHFMVE